MRTQNEPVAGARWRQLANVDGQGRSDLVADEAPLEIQVGARGEPVRPVAVVLRSRIDEDDDLDLAVGFLVSEGVIEAAADVERIAHCDTVPSPDAEGNVVQVRLREGVAVDWERLRRHTFSSSSCGVCGKATIDAVCTLPRRRQALPMRPRDDAALVALTALLTAHQPLFAATGAVHAAMLVDDADAVVVVREDVGRHNAVDKVIGHALRRGRDPAGLALVVSGRVAFEIVQKAVIAGLGGIVAVGGATSLAVDLAARAGLPLVGFVRAGRTTRYVDTARVGPDPAP
jgi:FdhD protein